ncbi:7 transmembrane sweet-taste receptor of 3 GCPR-domain-containing protein [Neocallimastix sp. 'constans']
MLYPLYHLINFFILLKVINAIRVINEKDFINALTENYNEALINITTEIDIKSNIIIRNSYDSSILNIFQSLSFESTIDEIEIKNITINGNLNFINNKRVALEFLIINGNINSDFSDGSNEYVKLKNILYHPYKQLSYNCINLSGNVFIENSEFHGNSICRNRIIHYDGLKIYNLNIKYTKFSGEYQNSCLSIYNTYAEINFSNFEKGFCSEDVDGGSAVMATLSKILIENCTFEDLLCYSNGGALNFYNNKQIKLYYSNFYNTTSTKLGSLCHVSSNTYSTVYFNNIIQKNTGNIEGMDNAGGLIMNIENQVEVIIEWYTGENLINRYGSGSAFNLSNRATLTLTNIKINNLIGNDIGGLFYNSQNSYYITLSAKNITLNNLYQLNRKESTLMYFDTNNIVNFVNLIITNSGGFQTSVIDQHETSIVKITNFEIDNYKSEVNKELIFFDSSTPRNEVSLEIYNLKINNIISPGVLFRLHNGRFNLINGEIKNVHMCNLFQNCTTYRNTNESVNKAVVIYTKGFNTMIFNNTNFENIYGDTGVLMVFSKLDFNNGSISNSYLKNGFFAMDEGVNTSGLYVINNSTFVNNTSEYGTILNIKTLEELTGSTINVTNSEFISNRASKYGGAVYSIGEFSNLHVYFDYCKFIDNHALLGDIFYSYSRESSPLISNIEELELIEGALVTNPVKIILDNDNQNSFSILSGDMLPKNITYKIYDDYDREMKLHSDLSDINFNDFIFTAVEINDTYNARLIGPVKNYCWGNDCSFPSLKVIGNPGVYTLKLQFQSFGPYVPFKNSSIYIQVEILECNEDFHNYQNFDDPIFKSCYIPKCQPSCNTGKCINMNLCDCTGTHYTGKYCDEYKHLKRNNYIDIGLSIIIYFLICITILIIFITIYFKDKPNIKGGGTDFLIIILIGSIITLIYSLFLTYERTKTKCYLIFLTKNTGFSLVFGSIFVKTLRIYKIFRITSKVGKGLSKKVMFLIIMVITLFHWITAYLWFAFKKVKIISYLTGDYEEYLKCHYPPSKNINEIINFIVLAYGFILSYLIRNAENKFKENLGVVVYFYVLIALLGEIIDNQNEINILIQDFFGVIGMSLINIIILYFLYIEKFRAIYYEKSIKPI